MTLKVEIGGSDIGDAILVAAAVVQAVGSVAAIIAVGVFGHLDRVASRREAMSDRVGGLAALIFRAEELVKRSYDILAEEGWGGYPRMVSEWGADAKERGRCAAALKAIPLHELQNWELVRAVMEMIEALARNEAQTNAFIESNRLVILYEAFGPPDTSELASGVNMAAEAAARLHNQAHFWSSRKAAHKHRIKPRIVA